jgi:hypothetical protein
MQTALTGISNAVTGGVLTQVNYTGGSTLPAVTTAGAGVVATSNSTVPLAPFGLGAPYGSAVIGSAAVQQVLVNFGTNGAIIASGDGGSTISSGASVANSTIEGAQIGNLGTNTQVFFGGAAVQDFSELGLGGFGGSGGSGGPSATVWVTTPLRGSATFDDSSGQTTINLDTVASSLGTVAHPFGQTLVIENSGNGQTTINVADVSGLPPGDVADGMAMSFRGTSSVATTVNAAGSSVAGSGNTEWDLLKSGSVFINGNGSDIILFPTGAGVAATLFGGSGSDIDAGAAGSIVGGSAGNNVLFGGTTAGSTTLIGGGSGDTLVQQSAGNTFGTGAGHEQLFGLVPGDTYMEAVANTVAGGNAATIGGFVSGVDSVSLSNPAGGNYTVTGQSTTVGTPGVGTVDFVYQGSNTLVQFGDGTTWTVLNAHVQTSDFK